MRARHRLLPVVLLVAAVVLAAAGAVTWRTFSPPHGGYARRPSSVVYYFTPEPHRLHPVRAEMLWSASVACAVLAVVTATRRPRTSRPEGTA